MSTGKRIAEEILEILRGCNLAFGGDERSLCMQILDFCGTSTGQTH
jgi:hypothetical protein